MSGILLDIEGTTTPISFVYSVLFPYARNHLARWIAEHERDPVLAHDFRLLRQECDDDRRRGLSPPEGIADYCLWLMDQDRKSTGLKSIQGRIWATGYQMGQLKGEVFPDVPSALRTWSHEHVDVRIFSSGSVLAQKLLFGNSTYGDLTPFLGGYFDTTSGSKTAEQSYLRIARDMGLAPSDIVFVSDTVAELDAARTAGMKTLLALRSGNAPQPGHAHRVIENFREIPCEFPGGAHH
jgi:enolase-phosphatase E1